MDGTVIAQDSATGSIIWELSCANIGAGADCQDSVEAEFVLSSDGTHLYFGDFKGRIVSLAVAIDNSKLSSSSGAQVPITSAPASHKYAPHSASKPEGSTYTTSEISSNKDINSTVASISTYSPSGTASSVVKPNTSISSSNPSNSSNGHSNTGSIYASTFLPTSSMKKHQNSSQTLSQPTSTKSHATNTTECKDRTTTGNGCAMPALSSPVPGPAAPQVETKTHTKKLIPVLSGPEAPFTSLQVKATKHPSAYSFSSQTSTMPTLVYEKPQPSQNSQPIAKIPFALPTVRTVSLEPFHVDFGEAKPSIHSIPRVSHQQPIALSLKTLPISLPVEKLGSSQPLPTYHNSDKTAHKPTIQISSQPTVSALKNNPLNHGHPLLVSPVSFVPTDLSPENPSPPSFRSDSFSTPSMAKIHQHAQPVTVYDQVKPSAKARRPSAINWKSEQTLPSYGTYSLTPSAGEKGRNFVDKSTSPAVIVPAAAASAVVFFIIALVTVGYAAFQVHQSHEKQRSDEQRGTENEE